MSIVRIKGDGIKAIITGCDVYIGREYSMGKWKLAKSKWANPFSFEYHGRDESLKLYKEYILRNEELFHSLSELKDKVLGCWCKPDKCHGDILIELLNEY